MSCSLSADGARHNQQLEESNRQLEQREELLRKEVKALKEDLSEASLRNEALKRRLEEELEEARERHDKAASRFKQALADSAEEGKREKEELKRSLAKLHNDEMNRLRRDLGRNGVARIPKELKKASHFICYFCKVEYFPSSFKNITFDL